MNENTNVQEAEFDQAFVDGLMDDGEPQTEPAEDPVAEEAPADDGNQTGTGEDPAAEEQGEGGEKQPEEDPKEELYEVKHLKETKQLTLEQLKENASKGMDYDRIRQRADQLAQENEGLTAYKQQNEGILSILGSMAHSMNMEIPDFLVSMRANLLVSDTNMNREAAQKMAQSEVQAAAKAFNDAKEQAAAKEQQQAEWQARVNADIQNFRALYPDVTVRDAMEIPSVQEAMLKGSTLVDAYTRYQNEQLKLENQRLQQEKQAAAQNNANRSRAIGSARTSGANKAKVDPFLEGFDD